MKRILLTFLVILAFSQISIAQVGIGTAPPNSSAQLEVVSADRGILIPRIELESTTDQSTIRNGNVNSLMVFNTQTVNDVSPGYYYWYVDKWYKLATTAGEIITTLIDNENGTYLYTSENGTQTLIDIPTSVVNDIINQGDVYTEIINLIDTNETVTIIEDHGNGTYTYYNENKVDASGTIVGSGVTINVVGDVVTNIQNQGDIYDEIINILEQESDELIDNGDGTYTHIAVDGTLVVIDVPSSVVENFENIYNQIVNEEITVDGDTYNSFEEYLTTIINNATTFEDNDFIEVSGDGSTSAPYKITIIEGDDNSMLITNEDGDLEWATIESIVQGNETITRIEEENGIYTYYNEKDEPFVIDIPSSVVENFENIYNQIVNEEITVDGDTYNSFEEYLTTFINNATTFEDNAFIKVEGDGSTSDPYKITIVEGDANSMLITNED